MPKIRSTGSGSTLKSYYSHIELDGYSTENQKAAKTRRLEAAIKQAITNHRDSSTPYLLGDHEYTNSMAIRDGIIPCENNPQRGTLSKLSERFHGAATVTTGSLNPVTHCCKSCADKWHKHQEQRPGIRWA